MVLKCVMMVLVWVSIVLCLVMLSWFDFICVLSVWVRCMVLVSLLVLILERVSFVCFLERLSVNVLLMFELVLVMMVILFLNEFIWLFFVVVFVIGGGGCVVLFWGWWLCCGFWGVDWFVDGSCVICLWIGDVWCLFLKWCRWFWFCLCWCRLDCCLWFVWWWVVGCLCCCRLGRYWVVVDWRILCSVVFIWCILMEEWVDCVVLVVLFWCWWWDWFMGRLGWVWLGFGCCDCVVLWLVLGLIFC